ncbi:MAG: hypothetical protein ACXV7I_15600 [Ilumatobacteraceae bacterium]|jgi:hypothetical protein
MADTWRTIAVNDVRPGDRIRHRDQEFTVARVDSPFLGMDQMVCFIEDTPTRWAAWPAARTQEVEITGR